jgi:hypothetical protein
MNGATTFLNPLKTGPTVVVAAVGEAEGSRGAAAALACAGADADAATLLVDIGGRAPRPALLASAAAQKLEERLEDHLSEARVAARGQVCHLAVPADAEGLESAAAAVAVARAATAVVHVPPWFLQAALSADADLDPTGVLLRADLTEDRPLVAIAVRGLLVSGLAVAVLKRRLNWVAERRAFFGTLPQGSPGSLPPQLVRRLRIAS